MSIREVLIVGVGPPANVGQAASPDTAAEAICMIFQDHFVDALCICLLFVCCCGNDCGYVFISKGSELVLRVMTQHLQGLLDASLAFSRCLPQQQTHLINVCRTLL